MSLRPFKLEIITPERLFFSGQVESVTVDGQDGQLSVLAGHAPLIAALKVGQVVLGTAHGKVTCFSTAGFMEVRPDETLIFAQKCEWPEEIDEGRALADEEEARIMLQRQQSMLEYRESRIMLTRALMRLRVKGGGPK